MHVTCQSCGEGRAVRILLFASMQGICGTCDISLKRQVFDTVSTDIVDNRIHREQTDRF
jgi:hypothetical protein